MQKKQQLLLKLVFLLLLSKVESDDHCTTRFDSQVESYCTRLTINSTHNCKYLNGICDYNYASCSSYAGKDETTCKSIKLSNSYKKCEIVGETCTEVDKDCDDYVEGLTCSDLKAGDNKRCVLNSNNQCVSHYNLCSNFVTNVDKSKCEANIPDSSSKKCEWDGSACKDVDKKCNDYSQSYYYCSSLKTSDDTNKICMTSSNGNTCVEQYKTCELYNTKATSKNKDECEELRTYSGSGFDDSKVCTFSGNTCSTRDKSCQDIKEDYNCLAFTPKDGNKICIYSGGQCKEQYKTCDLYNEKVTTKSKTDCESLRIYSNGNFDDTKICTFSSSTCSERDKTCEDITNDEECEYFQPNDNKVICILNGGRCQSQYKTCKLYNDNVDSKKSDECEAIKIFSDTLGKFDDSKICSFSESTCSTRDKLCTDNKDENSCLSFNPTDTNKRCIYSGGKCKEQYKTCELYNNNASPKSEDECLAIQLTDNSYECKYNTESSTCSAEKKPCSSFTTSSSCNNHTPKDGNKMCIFTKGECKESYKTCELYESNEASKNKDNCEIITPYKIDNLFSLDRDSKCVFNNENHCIRQTKDCSEFSIYDYCVNHILDDDNKKCLYKNGECKSVYKTCEAYNNDPNKNEEGCKEIILKNEKGDDDYSRICVYESNNCKEKTLTKCSDYVSGKDEYYCTSINRKTYKHCILKDNNCVEEFTDCPGNSEDVSEEICTSIIPPYDYNKCTMDDSNKCISTLKSCTEYKGSHSYYCTNYAQAGENKKCFFEDGNCVEKYIYCEGYTGNDKDQCESIIPYSEGTYSYSLGETYKCSLENDGCKKVEKKCEDAKSSSQCNNIYNTLKNAKKIDSNKKCKYNSGKCFEQYEECSDYTSNVEKEECESIILDSSNEKCEFVPGSPNTCEKKGKLCSDIIADNYKDYCQDSITPVLGKKCVFSNSACKESNLSCKELENNSRVTEEICSAAPTSDSNRKKCELKSDNSGCQETDKPNNNNKSTLGPEFKFGFFIIIFTLLL